MGVDLNVTIFLDHVVNQPAFREEISSRNPERIKAALRDERWMLNLSDDEIEAAAAALLRAENLSAISNLEEILSHSKINFRGN